MSTKEDLQTKIHGLTDKLTKATDSLNKILCDEYPYQPGMKVIHYGKIITVSRVGIKYGAPRAWGNKTLKDGSLGSQEFELYGTLQIAPEVTK